MYQAKSRGKAGYVVFDEAMHAEAVTRLQLDTDLRQATGTRRIRISLPADRVAPDRKDQELRGPVAVEPPRPRSGLPGRLRPAGRGDEADPAHRLVGHPHRRRTAQEMAVSSSG